MVPEECSLPNSLHLFAFFTLHSPLKSSTGAEAPSKAMKLPGIWKCQNPEMSRKVPSIAIGSYPRNSNVRKRRWEKDAQQPASDWLVGWREKKQGVTWVLVTSLERAKKSAEVGTWTMNLEVTGRMERKNITTYMLTWWTGSSFPVIIDIRWFKSGRAGMRQRLEVVSFRREVAFTLDLSGVVASIY